LVLKLKKKVKKIVDVFSWVFIYGFFAIVNSSETNPVDENDDLDLEGLEGLDEEEENWAELWLWGSTFRTSLGNLFSEAHRIISSDYQWESNK